MKHFGYGIAAGLGAVLAGIALLFGLVAALSPENMPAPAITNLVHLDEKFRFLRRHPEFDPEILAVGSSITWRQLSGDAFETGAEGRKNFLNGATGFLKIHQTRALLDFYVRRFRNVRVALVMVSLPDFRDCTTEPRELFAERDAERYVFGHWPSAYFYFRYFSPRRYLEAAMSLARRRSPFTGDLYIDSYGSGPIALPDDERPGLRYREMDVDPRCVTDLTELVRDMKERGVRVLVVFTPVHPEYRQRYPQAMRRLETVMSLLQEEEGRNSGHLATVGLASDPAFQENSFYDAFHLQWPAARDLSDLVARRVMDLPTVVLETEFRSGGR